MLMLMTLDVLFIDELGQWSDTYIAVIDIILSALYPRPMEPKII